jgi:hypothetical protein
MGGAGVMGDLKPEMPQSTDQVALELLGISVIEVVCS